MRFIDQIYNKWRRVRFRPIRVFCFHHVCKRFDEKSMNKCDWMDIDDFKRKINDIKRNGYVFISLSDCYGKLLQDLFRFKRYAVVTFDDGYYSIKEIMPWLVENKIPVTLFINGKYLDGRSYRDTSSEKYLTIDELFELRSSYIEIGSHGWEHTDCTLMKINEFESSVIKNIGLLSNHPRYVPFWAYAWGKHNSVTDECLRMHLITPVYVDGMKNFNDSRFIHREVLSL